LKATGRTQRLLLLESATLLGIVSTLLTWLVFRVEPLPCPFLYFGCCPATVVHRGFPLAWVTQIDWLGHCRDWMFVCPPITQLTVDWFGLAVDLLFWTLLFALLLGLWWDLRVRRHRTVGENG